MFMNNMIDNLGDCGAGNSVDLGGDVSFSASKEFGDGCEIGLGISADSGETSRGGLLPMKILYGSLWV